MKKIYAKRVIICIFLCQFSFLLSACNETDSEWISPEESNLQEDVDVTQIDAPKTAGIYEAEHWWPEDEKVIEAFLDDQKVEKENQESTWVTYAVTGSERRSTVSIEEDLDYGGHVSYDIGLTPEEQKREKLDVDAMSMALSTWEAEQSVEAEAFSLGPYAIAENLYIATTKLGEQKEEASDENAVGTTEVIKQKLDMPKCELRCWKWITVFDDQRQVCLQYWQQMVEGIPVLAKEFDSFATSTWVDVYNRYLDYDNEMIQVPNEIQVAVEGNQVVTWSSRGLFVNEKRIKNPKIVSAEQAIQKVRQIYSTKRMDYIPRLELAELQYKSIVKDSKILLIPVWVFSVVERSATLAQADTVFSGEIRVYYLVDAVTGEFFTGKEY